MRQRFLITSCKVEEIQSSVCGIWGLKRLQQLNNKYIYLMNLKRYKEDKFNCNRQRHISDR